MSSRPAWGLLVWGSSPVWRTAGSGCLGCEDSESLRTSVLHGDPQLLHARAPRQRVCWHELEAGSAVPAAVRQVAAGASTETRHRLARNSAAAAAAAAGTQLRLQQPQPRAQQLRFAAAGCCCWLLAAAQAAAAVARDRTREFERVGSGRSGACVNGNVGSVTMSPL